MGSAAKTKKPDLKVIEGGGESSTEHEAIYNVLRPHDFKSMIGQSHITDAIRNLVVQNRVPRAQLFVGERGTGKTSLARIVAAALNCSNRTEDGEPCGECASCQQIALDVECPGFIVKDANSYGNKDDILALLEEIQVASPLTKYKVVLIDEAHGLSAAASESLLDVIENPPRNVYWILATTELQKMKDTIISRCTKWTFRSIDHQAITDALESAIARFVDESEQNDILDLVPDMVDEARGSLREAYSVLERVIGGGLVSTQRVIIRDLLNAIADADIAEMFLITRKVFNEDGTSPQLLVQALSETVSDAMIALRAPEKLMLSDARTDELIEIAEQFKQSGLTSLAASLAQVASNIGAYTSINGKFIIQSALVSYMVPVSSGGVSDELIEKLDALSDDIADVNTKVEAIESRLTMSDWPKVEHPKPKPQHSDAMSSAEALDKLRSLSDTITDSDDDEDDAESDSDELSDETETDYASLSAKLDLAASESDSDELSDDDVDTDSDDDEDDAESDSDATVHDLDELLELFDEFQESAKPRIARKLARRLEPISERKQTFPDERVLIVAETEESELLSDSELGDVLDSWDEFMTEQGFDPKDAELAFK